VTLYCAQDQVYAEPILAEFTRTTGIRVRSVFDNEAVKTVGMANRLLAERSRPVCDVFWSNEELRTRQLAAHGVFRENPGWTAVGFRTRRLVINTKRVALGQWPLGLHELTNASWRGKVAIAYPLFGSTATHVVVLRQRWGAEGWERWCRALRANDPWMVDGNSAVVRLVGQGEAWVGWTDSDDVARGIEAGYPIAVLPVDDETLYLPNTVAVVRDAPHSEAAEQLRAYLSRADVMARLVAVGAIEEADPGSASARGLEVDWALALRELESAMAALERIFLR
jgi:iron(III) transport system substrate-binding protein